MTPPTSVEAQAFQSGIDPNEYHMGPGDILQCRFWTSGDAYYPVVSSDQSLVVPLLGSFDVRGKTLDAVRQEILQKASESFAKSKVSEPVSITLYQPRKVYVKVQGDVLTPGAYVLSAATRADIVVDLANHKNTEATTPPDFQAQQRYLDEQRQSKQLQSIFGNRDVITASQRYIQVSHNDGTTDRVDIVRYNALHDPKSSPPLREGDVIDVPFRDVTAGVLGVYGAVRSPGDFEFVQGDSLSSAIKYAFGPTAQADLAHVEISRSNGNGEVQTKVYNVEAILSHSAPDVPLQRGDIINVPGKHESMHSAVVAVRGEVEMPGVYPIREGETHIADVVKEAGGLTPYAYPKGSRVLRHGPNSLLMAGTTNDIQRVSRLANMTVEDTASFARQLAMREPDIAVDLDRVLTQGDKSADVTLADGDEIIIQRRPTTVYVSGFVNRSGYVSYQEGAPLRYYIAQAGGYAPGAVKSETVVIKAGTKAWSDPSDTRIDAGDEIFVPKEPDIPLDVKRNEITSYATLALAIASFALTLYNTFHKP